MEPKFQTSFIPKSPVVAQGSSAVHVTHSTNIFSAIATVVFLATIIASGGAFVYKNVLTGQIATVSSQLDAARANFQPSTIQELVDANGRIVAVKTLLQKHVAVSALLGLLQNMTLKKVQFSTFTYVGATADNPPTLTMDTTAATYNALAQQELVFSQNQFIKNPKFSDFVLGDNGTITANFFATLDPGLVSYAKVVSASGGSQ